MIIHVDKGTIRECYDASMKISIEYLTEAED